MGRTGWPDYRRAAGDGTFKKIVEAFMLEIIKSRRSIRCFKKQAVESAVLHTIIEAGTWAPSGLNNQPWKFVIIRSQAMREKLAGLTKYGRIICDAPDCIAVFLDISLSYDHTKDVQAIGACIQNMLLQTHALGLGAVWLGEIVKNSAAVRELLTVPGTMEFMALIALGYPAEKNVVSERIKTEEVILCEL
jgi:nitroreductase